MKKLLSIIAAAAVVAGLIYAQAATYTRQTARISTFVVTPGYDAGGNVTAATVQSNLVQILVNNVDATDARGGNTPITVTFDMLDPTLSAVTITAAAKTVTYPQLAALMRQAVLDRATAA